MTIERPIYINAVSAVTCLDDIISGSKPPEGYARAVEPDIRRYFTPVQSRRMTRLLRRTFCTSLDALALCGATCPDAIVTATANGCWENSENFLRDMQLNGEQTLKPTLFMQSTHNTPGSALAIHLGCHGYNNTWSDGDRSTRSALIDSVLQLGRPDVHVLLLGAHDELTPLEAQMTPYTSEASVAMVLSDTPLTGDAVRIDAICTDEPCDTAGCDVVITAADIEEVCGKLPDPSVVAIALAVKTLQSRQSGRAAVILPQFSLRFSLCNS